MMSSNSQASEDQRRAALRDARQRIVELQAVRTYLQESGSSAAQASHIESLLAQALALEQTLIAQGKATARASRGRVSPVVAGLLFLGSWADDGVIALLEFALNLSLAT